MSSQVIEEIKKRLQKHAAKLRHVGMTLQGERSIIVSWTPDKEPRKRVSFSIDRIEEAESEATRIDDLMRRGYDGVAEAPRGEIAALVRFREQFPTVSLSRVFEVYALSENVIAPEGSSMLVKTAVEEFIESRNTEDFSDRHYDTVKGHLNRFATHLGHMKLVELNADHELIVAYLKNVVGGKPKTRKQNLITIRSFFRRCRDKKKGLLPLGPTAAEMVDFPKVVSSEHKVYTPTQFTRLLVFTSERMIMFFVLGQFAGIRSSERLRLIWEHWRVDEDNKIVCNKDVTKTERRRRVDVLPNLGTWLKYFRGEPDEFIVDDRSPDPGPVAAKAGLEWHHNGLRAGYASYHLELFQDAALTAKNDGHSVNELETDYMSISGVTKKTAQEMFDITPQAVLAYAKAHKLPTPEWAGRVKNHR